jgi:hypothetical protein
METACAALHEADLPSLSVAPIGPPTHPAPVEITSTVRRRLAPASHSTTRRKADEEDTLVLDPLSIATDLPDRKG